MSRGHSASRRRAYGPRQRDVRRRPLHPAAFEPADDARSEDLLWREGRLWGEEPARMADRTHTVGAARHVADREEAA